MRAAENSSTTESRRRGVTEELVVVGCWLLVSSVLAGCAGPGGQEETQREAPPEVTDQSVDERPNVVRNNQPRVDVELQRTNFTGFDGSKYEGKLRRGALECYGREIRRRGSEVEGAVVYEVLVTRNGKVAGTDVMSTRLNNDQIDRCVQRSIGRVHFEIPVETRPVYRLFFRFDFYLEEIVADDPPV